MMYGENGRSTLPDTRVPKTILAEPGEVAHAEDIPH